MEAYVNYKLLGLLFRLLIGYLLITNPLLLICVSPCVLAYFIGDAWTSWFLSSFVVSPWLCLILLSFLVWISHLLNLACLLAKRTLFINQEKHIFLAYRRIFVHHITYPVYRMNEFCERIFQNLSNSHNITTCWW